MSGAFGGAVAAALVAGTGLAVAATLGFRDLPRLILGAYVVGFTETVGLTLLLSAFDAVDRGPILIVLAGLFGASIAGWVHKGALPPTPVPAGALRSVTRNPKLLVLALANAVALLYVLALIVGTPPNNADALSYHLTRAAFWIGEDRVGYIADAYDPRLNDNPPNAELVLTLLLEVGRNERLAGFVQFAAALMLATGVFALARKLSIGRPEAAFGALLFLSMPIVILQASTAENDLVAASLLLSATVFLAGNSRRELVLAATATALAVGTKIPAAYGVPVLCAFALVARPGTLRWHRIGAVLVGAAAGSYWYAVNVLRTGHPLGDLTEVAPELAALFEPKENFFTAYGHFLDAFDLSGSDGADVLVYALVAIGVIALRLGNRGDRRGEILPVLVTGGLILTPLVFVPLGYAFRRVFTELGGPDALGPRFLDFRGWGKGVASDSVSGYGPLGALLVVGLCVTAAILVRRRSLPPAALVAALAPVGAFVLFSLTLGYDIGQSRFFMFSVALSASLWGLILRIDRYAMAAVAISATSTALSLLNFTEKPSGFRLIERDVAPRVWGADRWEVQSVTHPESAAALRFLAELPPTAHVALALGFTDLGYPAFGPHLQRHVDLVPEGSGARESRAEWLLANPTRAPEIHRQCWRVVLTTPEGWVGFRRASQSCGS